MDKSPMIDQQNQLETKMRQSASGLSLGLRLKTARESLRLTEKDAAARLHLNAKWINVLEQEDFKNGLPATFMRGYFRSYARLLNLSEEEIFEYLEQLDKKLTTSPPQNFSPALLDQPTQKNYHVVRWTTYGIIACLITLVCIWWNSHPHDTVTEKLSKPTPVKTESNPPTEIPVTPSVTPAFTPIVPPANVLQAKPETPTSTLPVANKPAALDKAMSAPEPGLENDTEYDNSN